MARLAFTHCTAVQHARHGDFSKLDDLAADITVAIATMGEGAVTKAGTVARGGKGRR
jgi:hypothetical protein